MPNKIKYHNNPDLEKHLLDQMEEYISTKKIDKKRRDVEKELHKIDTIKRDLLKDKPKEL